MAAMHMPIISIDFLEYSDLLVDSRNHRLVDHRTSIFVNMLSAGTVPIRSVYQAVTGETYCNEINHHASAFRAILPF